MPDEIIECAECHQEFTFSEREQNFFKEKRFTPPKRCKPCREYRKQQKKHEMGNQK